VLASGALRARGKEPRGAAERPTVSGRAAGGEKQGRGKGRRGKELTRGPRVSEREENGGVEGNGLGACWAMRSPRGEGNGERGMGCRAAEGKREGERGGPAWPMREEGGERESWTELGQGFGLLPFLLLSFFSFLYSNIQTKLFEFKIQFEFKPINSTQIKQCCSMNAQTI
jgi:hypothetical protein